MKEKDLQKAIVQHLTYLKNTNKLFFIRINSGLAMTSYTNKGGSTKSFPIRLAPKGTSDLIIFLRGKTAFIELKGDKGKQSPEQIEFQRTIQNLGYEYHLWTTYEEFEDFLKNNLDKVVKKSIQ